MRCFALDFAFWAKNKAYGVIVKRGPKIPRGRLERVEELWLRCIPETKIAAKLALEFECSRRNVWRYIALVREKLKSTRSTRTPEEERERVESLLSEAEDLARKNEDARAFVQCVRTRSELNSLLGPRRFEVSGPDGGPLQTQAKIVVLPELDAADPVDAQPRPADPLSGEHSE